MNTAEMGIDQSVNSLTKNTLMKNLNSYVSMFPFSKAEQLKSALVNRFRAEYADVAAQLVYQAVNEAYALVSATSEPLLFRLRLRKKKFKAPPPGPPVNVPRRGCVIPRSHPDLLRLPPAKTRI